MRLCILLTNKYIRKSGQEYWQKQSFRAVFSMQSRAQLGDADRGWHFDRWQVFKGSSKQLLWCWWLICSCQRVAIEEFSVQLKCPEIPEVLQSTYEKSVEKWVICPRQVSVFLEWVWVLQFCAAAMCSRTHMLHSRLCSLASGSQGRATWALYSFIIKCWGYYVLTSPCQPSRGVS